MNFLASSFTWFNLIPGFAEFEHSVAEALPKSVLDGESVHITHVALATLVTLIIVGLVAAVRSSWSSAKDSSIPEGGISIRNLVELVFDAGLGLMEPVLGSKESARRFFPLIASLSLYILISNLLGLVPGFAPPTDNLNITLAPALVVFFVVHFVGIKAQGFHYVEHFLGPKIGGIPWLAPLFLIIEIISHVARPASLSMRLMGNMTGDHMVMAVFLALVPFIPLFYPIPILILGTLVCLIQTLVFCLLTTVYIALAIEHSEEAH